jgi:hypothetical protein
LWIIESGAKPGEMVIVEGIQKVRPGVQVSAKLDKSETADAFGQKSLSTDSNPADAKGK